jgi:UPF0755 protein
MGKGYIEMFKRKNLLIGFWLILIGFCFLGYKIYSDVFHSNVSFKYAQKSNYLLVSSHKDILKFYSEVESGYYLDNFASFRRLAKLVHLEDKLKPGRYLLNNGMSNFDLLKKLISGRQESINIVFNSAERLNDLSGFFGQNLELDSNTLFALMHDVNITKKYGFDTFNFIGMFVPNTYNFYWNTTSSALLERMKREYDTFWTKDRLAKAIGCRLSPQQVSTLASIVQKESNKNDEMPIVAGVYMNRLRLGMPLQADPTIIYAWNDSGIKRVTNIHTSIVSPYNTYKNIGLPPGPICAPNIKAIDAVLNYAQHNYIYFCAREDFSGYHAFASSFQQHQQNARRYQLALNAMKIN